MNERTEMPRAGTPEFFAARQVASELMIRALFQMHPNKEQVRLYLDRMLGMSLVQPGLLDQPGLRGAADPGPAAPRDDDGPFFF